MTTQPRTSMRNHAEGGGLVGGPPVRVQKVLDKREVADYIGRVRANHDIANK